MTLSTSAASRARVQERRGEPVGAALGTLCIETPRLCIAPCDEPSARELSRLVADPRVAVPYYVARFANGLADREIVPWQTVDGLSGPWRCVNLTVRHRDTRQLVGNVQFTRDNLGYFVAPDFWRQGYGTEMVRACCEAAAPVLGLEVLHASVERDNRASRHILEALGFRFCGLSSRARMGGNGLSVSMVNYARRVI